MQLNGWVWSVTLTALVLVGCGPNVKQEEEPETWMQGWFSSRHPSDSLIESTDTQFYLSEDGSGLWVSLTECGGIERSSDMQWERVDSNTVEVSNQYGHQYIIRKLEGCNAFDRVSITQAGTLSQGFDEMHPGRICMRRGEENPDCNGSGCTVCEKSWCEGDEPAVTCEGDDE